jgi:putative SOS response-associated peptidase YedK
MFGLTLPEDFPPRYNVAPTEDVPVVRADQDGRRLDLLHWGLVPGWAEDPSVGNRMINARAETAATKPAFRDGLRRRRCLIPADGFYEWKKLEGGKRKQPYLFRVKGDRPFAFAGIWEENAGDDGHPLKTFAIITTGANPLVGLVHDRMPVILRKQSERQWINADMPEGKLLQLLDTYPASLLQMYEVSPRVNRTLEDSPELIKPV